MDLQLHSSAATRGHCASISSKYSTSGVYKSHLAGGDATSHVVIPFKKIGLSPFNYFLYESICSMFLSLDSSHKM
jgi:hypothetical protein